MSPGFKIFVGLMLMACLVVVLGCSTFTGDVSSMREQAQLCTGEVTFKVIKYNGHEKIAYTCHWEEMDELEEM